MKNNFLILLILTCFLTDSFAGKNKKIKDLLEDTLVGHETRETKRLKTEDNPTDSSDEYSDKENSSPPGSPPPLESLTPEVPLDDATVDKEPIRRFILDSTLSKAEKRKALLKRAEASQNLK